MRKYNALFLGCAFLGLASCGGPSAKTFLTDALKGDNSEIELGKLAAQKAPDPDVKAYGSTLVADHQKALTDASAVAQKLGVDVPTEMTSKANDELNKLNGLSGNDFDKEFVNYMVDDHKNDISEFKRQANDTDDAAVADLARNTLPTLQKHLELAQSLKAKTSS